MHTQTRIEVDSPLADLTLPNTRRIRLARVVSQVFSPVVIAVLILWLVGETVGTVAGWLWLGVYLVVGVGAPTAYVAWLTKTGRVTDFDLRRRDQRVKPFMLSLACMMLVWAGLWLGDGPAAIRTLVTIGIVQGLALFVVTLAWKISLHTAGVATFAMLACVTHGWLAVPLLLLIPLVAWSRVSLRRHTLLQTVCGGLVGALAVLTVTGW